LGKELLEPAEPAGLKSLLLQKKYKSVRWRKTLILLSGSLFLIFLITAIMLIYYAVEIPLENLETVEAPTTQKAPLTYYVFNRVAINAVFSLNLLLLMILLLVLFRNLIKLYLAADIAVKRNSVHGLKPD